MRGQGLLALADTAAFLSFQVPLYAALLWLAGTSPGQAVTAIVAATVAMAVLGRPYGVFSTDSAASLPSGQSRGRLL